MPATIRQLRGARAEQAARRWLQQQGLRFVAANVRCRFGEIDLVMRDGHNVVFVEVRLRRNPRVSAAATVDSRKQRKLAATASWFLSRHHDLDSLPVRFDVIAIDGRSSNDYALQWIRDAFRPGA